MVNQLTAAQRCYLDFLRFFGAFLVVFGHASDFFLEGASFNTGNIQAIGVLIFFLISGFLISMSAFQKRANPHYTFRNFFVDRFARIYSCLLPALLLVPLIDAMMLNSPSFDWRGAYNWQNWFGSLFMLQDFPVFQVMRRAGIDRDWFITSFGSARQLWTISIEWWLYMSFGAMVFLVARHRRPKWAILLLVAVFAIEPFYYFVGGVNECMTILWIIGMLATVLFFRMPAIMQSTSLIAPHHWRTAFIALASFGVVCMLARFFRTHFVAELQFGLFLSFTVFGLLFAFGTLKQRVSGYVERPIAFLANYSYSLYLTHLPILTLVVCWMPDRRHDPALLIETIVAANLFAIAFAVLFERNHKHLARYLHKLVSPKPAIAPATAPATPFSVQGQDVSSHAGV